MAMNKDIARRIIEEGYVKSRLDVFDELCADDYVYHEPLSGALDRSGEKELVRDFHEGMSDMNVEILELIEEGDVVCYRWRATGTHDGMLFGFQPTGNSIRVEGIDVVRCSGGKIRETWTAYDTLGFLRQAGATVSAAEEPRPSA